MLSLVDILSGLIFVMAYFIWQWRNGTNEIKMRNEEKNIFIDETSDTVLDTPLSEIKSGLIPGYPEFDTRAKRQEGKIYSWTMPNT